MEGNVVNTDGTTQSTQFYSVTAIRLSKDVGGGAATLAMNELLETEYSGGSFLGSLDVTSEHFQ